MQVFLYLCSTMSNYKERGRMELAQLYFPQLGGIAAWKKLQHCYAKASQPHRALSR